MRPALLGHLAGHHGLVTRRRLAGLGHDDRDVRALVRSGVLRRLRRGVYADATVWADADEWRGRPLLEARAAVLALGGEWVLCLESAADLLGIGVLRPDRPRVHLTRPGLTRARTEAGVVVHAAPFEANQVVEVDGLRCLGPARTAVDIARARDLDRGVVAVDGALRRGVTPEQLEAAVAPMARWPGARQARAAVRLGDAGAETVAESLGRQLLRESGLSLAAGEPETQFPLVLPSGVRYADLRVGRLVVEVDGRLKYRAVADGGVAGRPIDEVVMAEKRREREIRDEQLGVSRLVFADFFGTARAAARARLRTEAEQTARVFGTELPPHLVRNAATVRARDAAAARSPLTAVSRH